ncbi:PSAK1 [Auxenochlorella protothecoides x Auxenochlorella symbiontica]|uniref:PSI-K n=1 Tax=Auxenochlorella protothecoides TaxID=3075 RepID=A0A1D1ZUA5_AUXPR
MQSVRSFTGFRANALRPIAHKAVTSRSRVMVVTRAGYIGSPTNVIMVLSTFLPIVAGRLGLAPTATRHTTPGLKLYEDKSAGLISGDPAGLTIWDVLALGALGHIIGVGIVLGLHNSGNL